MTVRRTALILLILTGTLGFAQPSSFHIKVPDEKGKERKAVLTFDDQDKALEVRPAKQELVKIPYGQIDKCSYEYTKDVMAAKIHWLEIHYHEQEAPKVLVLEMPGHAAIHILDALKAHAGIDAEILGNANKRHESVWRGH
jgi:hypothetical protein